MGREVFDPNATAGVNVREVGERVAVGPVPEPDTGI